MSDSFEKMAANGLSRGLLLGFLAGVLLALTLSVMNNIRLEGKIVDKNHWIQRLEKCEGGTSAR